VLDLFLVFASSGSFVGFFSSLCLPLAVFFFLPGPDASAGTFCPRFSPGGAAAHVFQDPLLFFFRGSAPTSGSLVPARPFPPQYFFFMPPPPLLGRTIPNGKANVPDPPTRKDRSPRGTFKKSEVYFCSSLSRAPECPL